MVTEEDAAGMEQELTWMEQPDMLLLLRVVSKPWGI